MTRLDVLVFGILLIASAFALLLLFAFTIWRERSTTSSVTAVPARGFQYYARRFSVLSACFLLLWSTDANSVWTRAVTDRSTIEWIDWLRAAMAFGSNTMTVMTYSAWIFFQSKAVFAQMRKTYPTALQYALYVPGPFFALCTVLFVVAAITDPGRSDIYWALLQGVFALVICAIAIAGVVTWAILRSELVRFARSASGTSSAALDLSYIQKALSTLSWFVGVSVPCGAAVVFLFALDVAVRVRRYLDGYVPSAATPEGADQPLSASIIILNLVAYIILAVVLWATWPGAAKDSGSPAPAPAPTPAPNVKPSAVRMNYTVITVAKHPPPPATAPLAPVAAATSEPTPVPSLLAA
jgi:hypothetical protein